MKAINYFIIIFFSFGIVCFPVSIFTFKYTCEGTEMFPDFYGNPFIFKSTSLATSMAYDYYFKGLLLNMLTWSLMLLLIRFLIIKIILARKSKALKIIYKGVIALLLLASMISLNWIVIGRNDNTWSWNRDMEKYAHDWGMTCKGEFKLVTH